MGRLLKLKGVKPHGFTQWPRDNFYLYGVIEPLTGDIAKGRGHRADFGVQFDKTSA
jgi:hypothetical protein